MKKDNATTKLEALLKRNLETKHALLPKRNKPFGVVYTRVSSKEQADNNSSLINQKKICTDYALSKEITIKEYFGGIYDSAKTDGRKEFQRMLSFAIKDKDIAFIIVLNYDRFSRSGPGASKLSRDLREQGIVLKSVTQEIDASTPSGVFQEDIFHLFNNYDNQQRASRTKINTREIMLKGYWPYTTPLGYKNLKHKHRACDHQYIITEEGKWLKKAFQLKAEGILSNKEIINKVAVSGLNLNEKNFRIVIANPFYAGYITGKLVNGQLIKGQHPPLINIKTFLKANELLMEEPVAGIAKKHRVEELPLKIFARDEKSDSPLTGYITKNNWYYKTRNGYEKLNVSANKLNELFRNMLIQFEHNKTFKSLLRKTLGSKIKEKMKYQLQDMTLRKKKITELVNKKDSMEERYAIGDLTKQVYEKYALKFDNEIAGLQKELNNSSFDSSNLDLIIEKGISIAENISQAWVASDFSNKQKLQYLLFPKGILYNKEKHTVRTKIVNSLFAEIPLLKKVSGKNKNGDSIKNRQKSSSVPRTGFEPAHPCERCHLKAVRLPISPPGHLSGGQI